MDPNYDKCILNLLSSILKVYNYDSEYTPLPTVDIDSCRQARNVILFVADGLGKKYVQSRMPYLKSKLIDTLTTVFPATTASAIFSYYTGLAPNQHGSIGWFTCLPELDLVSTILPFTRRGDQERLTDQGVKLSEIFPAEGYLFDKIKGAQKHVVTPANLEGNPVSEWTAGDAEISYYRNTDDMLLTLQDIIRAPKRKFIFTYFSEFDSVCHKFGAKSPEAFDCIKSLSEKLKALETKLIEHKTRMLICSDHGFLDTTQDEVIYLHKHPELKRCLQLPVSGDSRVKNCFLKRGFEKKFLNYVDTHLKDKCQIYSKEEILGKKLYGPFENNPKFIERIGDYVMIMKGAYIFLDYVPGEDFEHFNAGNHSGMSDDEMLVPVIQLGI